MPNQLLNKNCFLVIGFLKSRLVESPVIAHLYLIIQIHAVIIGYQLFLHQKNCSETRQKRKIF